MDAFIGINGATESRGRILLSSFFAASEIIATITTTATYPNRSSTAMLGFVLIWQESVEALLMFTWFFWGLASMALRSGKHRLARKVTDPLCPNCAPRARKVLADLGHDI